MVPLVRMSMAFFCRSIVSKAERVHQMQKVCFELDMNFYVLWCKGPQGCT